MRYLLMFLFTIILSRAEPITPLPQSVPVDMDKATLGKALFFDPTLSRDGTVSCATCHDIFNGGDDGKRVSTGIGEQNGSVNSPTVLNAVFNFRQFWDGRASDLQEQAAGPIENPVEMGNTFPALIKKLQNSHYRTWFARIYKEGITRNSITDAIAEFEKTLITPDSPFDRYLRGDKNAITQKQKEGYEIFKSKGCIACHHGRNVGGNMYNKFGIILSIKDDNPGRYNITKNPSDKYFFKVPSLRNVTKTAPYFHNGSVNDLRQAVYFMAKHQIGRPISEREVDSIVAFLHALEGGIPKSVTE
ncbi:MAG TPA: cytochrome-c peroxidase [Campylobacteraceae bacterium]|nr:cytochrome-c peroxidase [Campylobacteraceae bacterium]